MKNVIIAILLASSAFCASAQTSTAYSNYQQQSSVQIATVIGVRDVSLAVKSNDSTNQAIGTSVGGLLGGLLGAMAANGSSPAAGMATTGVFAIVGGAMGNKFASSGSEQEAQEVIIQNGNNMVAITQSVKDGVRFAVGQKVMIIGGGRIAPAPASFQ